MKVFIAYKYNNENLVEVEKILNSLKDVFEKMGHEIFFNFASQQTYDSKGYGTKEIMLEALSELDQADALFAFINSSNRSEGMLIEIGYAKAKGKPVIVAARKGSGVNSSKGVSDLFIEFENLEELYDQVSKLQI